MAQSTRSDKGQKRNAKPIYIDGPSLDTVEQANKNKQLAFMVHPSLYRIVVENAGKEPNNITSIPGVAAVAATDTTAEVAGRLPHIELKRTGLVAYVRKLVADAVAYTGEPVVPSARGGNVVGVTTLFNSVVADMFAMARTFATAGNLSEEQTKQLAFAQAITSVQANPALASIVINDDVLEAIWEGKETEGIEEDEDEEEEEEDDAE